MAAHSKILVIDDDMSILRVIKKILSSMHYNVVGVTSGEEALKNAVLEKPDLFILDIMMPGMDGFETARQLKDLEITSDIPIIMITGLDGSEDRVKAFEAGASDFISKPLDFMELKTRVASQLKIKKYYDHIANYNQHLEAEVMRRTEQLRRSIKDVNQFAEAAHVAGLARAEFLSNMSHELRTPLNGIVGMAMLALGTDLDDEQRDYIETIVRSSESLLNIINATLDFSEIEKGNITLAAEPIELRSWFEDIACMMRAKAAEEGLALKSHIAADVPDEFVGDPHRLRQAIVNLAGNAIKFTAEGSVSLYISTVELTSRKAILRFAVTDTGIGIESEKQQQLFDAFTQADGSVTRRYAGLGLGLTLADRLVKIMGGQIQIESRLGSGSTVSFTAGLALSDT